MKKGWKIKKIGDVCGLMTGGTPSRSKSEYFANGKVRWLVSGDIHQKEIFDCEGRITEAGMQSSSAKYLPVNSVLMALNGQGKTRGTVALLRTKATCNQSLVSIYPNDVSELMPEYLYHNLNGRYEEIRKITGDDNKDRRGVEYAFDKKYRNSHSTPPRTTADRVRAGRSLCVHCPSQVQRRAESGQCAGVV